MKQKTYVGILLKGNHAYYLPQRFSQSEKMSDADVWERIRQSMEKALHDFYYYQESAQDLFFALEVYGVDDLDVTEAFKAIPDHKTRLLIPEIARIRNKDFIAADKLGDAETTNENEANSDDNGASLELNV